MAVCLKHQDREAFTHCAACGKPICQECIVGNIYCSKECMERGSRAADRADDVIDKRRKAKKSSLPKKIIFIIILLALAAGAYWYYTNNKKELDRKARRLINSVEQKNRSTIKSNQYRAPDSRYKRDREKLVQ